MKISLFKQLNGPLLLCFVASLFIVILNIYIIPPILGIDDTFAQYMLEGGFPQSVIHVSYFDHCFLFYERLFVWLHQLFPHCNIMSIAYIGIHTLCATAVSFCLLVQAPNWRGLLAFLIYTFYFLLPFLSCLSYTSVAGHIMAATFLYCIIYIFDNKQPSRGFLLLSGLLLLLAAGFRAHLMLPMAVMATPVLLLGDKKTATSFACMLTVLGICIAGAIFQHQQDYRKNIPEWENIKATSDAFYYLSNHGLPVVSLPADNPALADKFILLKNAVYNYDYSLYDTKLMRQYLQHAQKSTIPVSKRILRATNWMRGTLRTSLVVLLALAAVICGVATQKNKRIAGFMIAAGISIMLFMAFYLKIPDYVSRSVFLLLFLTCIYLFATHKIPINNRYVISLSVTGMLFLMVRQAFDIYGQSKYNREQISHFMSTANFIHAHPDILFVEMNGGGNFNFSGFPALHCPADYPMKNICLDISNTAVRLNTLQHFGYSSIAEALLKGQKVVMIGSVKAILVDYMQQHLGTQVYLTTYQSPDTDLLLFIPQIGARQTPVASLLPAPGEP